jgi:hypothetical protein
VEARNPKYGCIDAKLEVAVLKIQKLLLNFYVVSDTAGHSKKNGPPGKSLHLRFQSSDAKLTQCALALRAADIKTISVA